MTSVMIEVPNSLFSFYKLHRQLYKSRTFLKALHTSQLILNRAVADPENVGKGQQGINFDTLGSWNNRLDFPILIEESIKKGRLIPNITVEQIAYSSLIGRRSENYDRVLITKLKKDLILCGIFDGHGGSIAAEYLYRNFAYHVQFWLRKCSSIENTLMQSFLDANNSLARQLYQSPLDGEATNPGSTATVCLLQSSSRLTVGHVGDSRVILCHKGSAHCLTTDHSPDNDEEAARIVNRNGFIQRDSYGHASVNGRLAMTRSIGDLDLKPYGVIASPQIVSLDIKHGHDAFVVLTTDGLNYVLGNQEIVDIIGNCSRPKEAADFITDQALHFGSDDNTTAVIIPFGAWGKFRGSSSVITSFGRSFSRSVFD